jgi:nucleoside-diphosphate-sugar epimerase
MRVLVTGGHGFIGSHLVRGLAGNGYDVSVLDLGPPPADLASVDYRFIQGDLFDPEEATRAWDPAPEVVVHLVGLADAGEAQRDPDRSFRLNVVSTERVLEMCRLSPPQRLIVPSTAIYGWHKWLVETLVQAYARCYGIPYTILRLFNVYGRGHRGIIHLALTRAREGQPLSVFGAEQLRDFVYAGDVLDALTRVIEVPAACDRVLNIGSSEGLTIREVIGLVREVCPELDVRFEEGGRTSSSTPSPTSLWPATSWGGDWRTPRPRCRAWSARR